MTTNGADAHHAVMMTDAPPDSSPFAQSADEFVFGHVWQRPGLSRRDRRLVTLACVCAADATGPIDAHLYAALASGDLTLDELREFVLQFAVYCGWPKASQVEVALRVQANRLLQERGEPLEMWPQLDVTSLGPEDRETRIAGGEKSFRDINLVDSPPRDSPYFFAGILNFVFGHVWQRPGISLRDRRLITVACVGLCDTVGPICAHVGSALRSGDISKAEMDELVLQFSVYSGFAKGQYLQEVADQEWRRIEAQRAAEGAQS